MNLVQTKNIEDSDDFTFDSITGLFNISPSVMNAINEGGKRYTLQSDVDNTKMQLVEYAVGKDPAVDGSVVGELAIKKYTAEVDDFVISGGVINFVDNSDPENPTTISFDTTSPIFSILNANSNSIKASGNGKSTALTMDIILDDSNQILKITTDGLSVDKNELLAYINSNLSLSVSLSANTLTVGLGTQSVTTKVISDVEMSHDDTTNKLKTSVNGIVASVDTVVLNDVFGNPLGSILKH